MDKITNSLLESFSDQFELKKFDTATRFEHFCNYSIISKLNRSSFELNDIHTGSGGDCGIDGLLITVNGRIIESIDGFIDFIKECTYLDVDLTFIQAKTSSSFDNGEMSSFINGIKDFLSDEPQLVQNQKIKEAKELWEAILTRSDMMHNRRPICRLYYVTTGTWQDDKNLVALIEQGKSELLNLSIFESVLFFTYGAQQIQKLYLETKNKLSTTITFQNRITLPDIKGIKEAYLGVIPFIEYMKLIQDENKTIYNIFYDNVRDFQGENRVNIRIKETLTKEKFDIFSVLNNGVTVVASSLTPAGNRFSLRDYQVVNGCQTSHVLHSCQNLDGIESVFVPIKIIVTDSDDIKTDITLATNSQTEVKPEQLESLSSFQKQLELYYSTEKSLQLHYERRSQQYNSLDIRKTQIISIPIQIKCFASMFLNSPHLVNGYYGTIFNRFKNDMFKLQHKLIPYYISTLCFYRIEQFARNVDLDKNFKKFKFHLLMIIKTLVIGLENSPLNSNKIEKDCERLKKILLNEKTNYLLIIFAFQIASLSGVDLNKDRYKTESESEMMRLSAEKFVQEFGLINIDNIESITPQMIKNIFSAKVPV
ncbi:AIPR family protein [Yersinia proxima]|uniref:AIPR family protein n=1 Tax=Yersinia proxima TaxID=2890316 RepID=UPI001D10B52C|nr:AIPR family protein [Yersinia proxima]